MKKINWKGTHKRICAWLLIAAMAFSVPFSNVTMAYGEENTAKRTSISSSGMNVPQSWTLNIKDSVVTAVLTDRRTEDALNAMLMLLEKEETNYNRYLNRASARLENQTCSMSLDLSDVEAGTYKLILWEKMTNSTYSGILGFYLVEVTEEGCYFAEPVLGESEEAFLKQVTEEYDPKLYDAVPCAYYEDIENMSEIIAKAEELTKNCDTDTEKLVAISDWIGENISYNTQGGSNGSDSGWVFENLRAGCVGFSKLFHIMVSSVGIPCVLVAGYASSECLYEVDENDTAVNHEWALVYMNSTWQIVDMTWNNQNEFIGENSEDNRLGNLGNYSYTGINPRDFSLTHQSKRIYAYIAAKGLKFSEQPKTTEFYQNEEFKFDGEVYMIDTAGRNIMFDNECLKISGYDMSKLGKQKVVISTGNLKLEYEITVKPSQTENAKIEFVKEPITKVFEQGSKFVFDGSIQYVNAQNESTPIDITDANLSISGYDMNKVGKQKVTISYFDCKLEYEITVNEMDLSGIYVSAANVTVNQESSVVLPVKLTNNSGIMGLGLDISYDADIFEAPTVTKGQVLSAGTFNDSITEQTNGSFKVLWSGTENVVTDGELFTINMKVKKGVQTGNYTIQINNRFGDTFDEAYRDVEIKCLPVVVTVKKASATPPTNPPSGGNSSTGGSTNTGGNNKKPSQNKNNSSSIKYPASVGTKLKYKKATYRVTQSLWWAPRVQYVSPNNKNIKNATIPDEIKVGGVTYRVTSVSANAFKNHKKLKKVSVGYNVTTIGKKAFYGCSSLQYISLMSVKTIGASAFEGCKKLEWASLWDTKTIGKRAFYNCKKLADISFYSGTLKSVGSKAFYKINKNAVIYMQKKNYKKYKKLLKGKYQKTTKLEKY